MSKTASHASKTASHASPGKVTKSGGKDEDVVLVTKSGEYAYDHRQDFDPKEHPRGEHGEFITKEEAGIAQPAKPKDEILVTKSGEYDHRQDFHPEDHPRDEHGHFIPKDDAEGEDAGKGHAHQTGKKNASGQNATAFQHERAREELREAARDFAYTAPRDEHGRFASEKE